MFAIYVETLHFSNKIESLWNTRSMLLSIAQDSNRSCVCVSAHIWQRILQPELCLCFSTYCTNVFYNRSCVCASAHIGQSYSTTGAVFVLQLILDKRILQPELRLCFSSYWTNVFYNRSCVCASAHIGQTYSTTGAVFVLQLILDKRILQPELCLCFSTHLTTYSTTGAVFVLQLTPDNVFYSCTFDRLATDPYRPSYWTSRCTWQTCYIVLYLSSPCQWSVFPTSDQPDNKIFILDSDAMSGDLLH